MRSNRIHIILFLLVVSALGLQRTGIDSRLVSSFYLESETEESIHDIEEFESEESWSSSDADGGGKAVATVERSPSPLLPFRGNSNSCYGESTNRSQPPGLYLLYCRLKLDC